MVSGHGSAEAQFFPGSWKSPRGTVGAAPARGAHQLHEHVASAWHRPLFWRAPHWVQGSAVALLKCLKIFDPGPHVFTLHQAGFLPCRAGMQSQERTRESAEPGAPAQGRPTLSAGPPVIVSALLNHNHSQELTLLFAQLRPLSAAVGGIDHLLPPSEALLPLPGFPNQPILRVTAGLVPGISRVHPPRPLNRLPRSGS